MINLENSINIAKTFLGVDNFFGLNIKYSKVDNPNILEVIRKNNDVKIYYGRLSSLFFGLSLIKQHILEKEFSISLIRNFSNQGLMHDCSRNGALNIDSAKQMILTCALFGFDTFMLYTEDTYDVKGEPLIGYLRGKYVKEEIKELENYADNFGIEIVPCIQTLSHLYHVLKWDKYNDCRDTYETFNVTEPKVLDLIDKMISSCADMFKSRKIHIGMDEAFDIGSGVYQKTGKTFDKNLKMLEHLNNVTAICKKYGFHPMMWIDMFFKLDPGFVAPDWYFNKGDLRQSTIDKIPDVNLVYWDYYHSDIKVYNTNFRRALKTSKKVIFADGSWRWCGFAPNITYSLKNTKAGLTSSIKNGIKETFVTCWGDCGNECSVNTNIYTLAAHACFDFYGKGSDKDISSLMNAVIGYSLNEWRHLEDINYPTKWPSIGANPCRYFLYQDILYGVFDYAAKEEYVSYYKKTARKLMHIAKNKNDKYSYMYKSLSTLCDVLSIKCMIGKNIRKAYKSDNKEELRNQLKVLKALKRKLDVFVEAYRYQWKKENKPFGYEVIDTRIGYVYARIKTSEIVINDYINGVSKNIAELDQEIVNVHEIPEGSSPYGGGFSVISTTNLQY